MVTTVILALIIVFSLLAVKLGTSALMRTGLSYDTSNFQSYSAFFGVGFTTHEAELVVNHPVRRRIIRDLILVGNIGLTSSLATVIVTFVKVDRADQTGHLLVWLLGGAVLLGLLQKLGILSSAIDWVVRVTLSRIGPTHNPEYEMLLRIQDGYCVSEVEIADGHRFAGKTLRESRPSDDGVIILGIKSPSGHYTGTPGPENFLNKGDVATVYTTEARLKELTGTSRE